MLALCVRQTERMGRGVFASKAIGKGDLIERCPVIPLTKRDEKRVTGTILEDYLFAWGKGDKGTCVCLGLGSLYNHSLNPNAAFRPLKGAAVIDFVALRDIREGEQIFIDYGWEDKQYASFAG
jgi:SET domain-containing protein